MTKLLSDPVQRRGWNAHQTTAVVLLLFCGLHSYGALISTPRFSAASDQVLQSMRSVHFPAQGFSVSWYGFYLGFGWFASTLYALMALQLWVIGRHGLTERIRDRPILILIGLANAVGAFLSVRFFFPAAIGFSCAACLGNAWGLLSDAVAHRRHRQSMGQSASVQTRE